MLGLALTMDAPARTNIGHPAATLNSQMRAMRSLFEAKNEFAAMITPWYRQMWTRPLQRMVAQRLGAKPFRLWEKLMALQSARMLKYYLAHFKELPPEDCISLRYEDLCREPDANMKRITDFLGAHPPASITYRDKIAPRESKRAPESNSARIKMSSSSRLAS